MLDFLSLAIWGKITLTSLITFIVGFILIQTSDNPFEKPDCGWGGITYGLTLLAMAIGGLLGVFFGLLGVVWCL